MNMKLNSLQTAITSGCAWGAKTIQKNCKKGLVKAAT